MNKKQYFELDTERYIQENQKAKDRTPFERDRARVLHSSAFRRLGFKTQVVVAGEDDFARTRLTHSLEVAQVGRQLAKVFGCDEDLVDTACLAHDLGHPPFGHNGERVLNELADDIGGFESNAQAFRILSRLEPKMFFDDEDFHKFYGLNLTRATLNACIKYPWQRNKVQQFSANSDENAENNKFGVYEEDLEVYNWVRKYSKDFMPSLEAQIMNIADDIAYCVHDLEDSIVLSKINVKDVFDEKKKARIIEETIKINPEFTADQLDNAFNRLNQDGFLIKEFSGNRKDEAKLKSITSQLIGRFVNGCLANIYDSMDLFFHMKPKEVIDLVNEKSPIEIIEEKYKGQLVVPKEILEEIVFLKGIGLQYYGYSKEHDDVCAREKDVLTKLFDLCISNEKTRKEIMSPAFLHDFEIASSDREKKRVVIDQIASLTDISGQKRDRL